MDEVLLKTSSKGKRAAFVLYILCGLAGFLVAADRLTLPVYETVEGSVRGERELLCAGELPEVCSGEPVFVYETREDAIEKFESYQMENNRLLLEERTRFADGTSVRLELPVGRVSLLRLIFRKGGAL